MNKFSQNKFIKNMDALKEINPQIKKMKINYKRI